MPVTPIDFAALLRRLDPKRLHDKPHISPKRGGLDGAIAEGVEVNTPRRRRYNPPPETKGQQ